MRLTLEELEKLSTPRLLAYFKKHRHSEYSEVIEPGLIDDEEKHAKNVEYFDGIRAILNKRGHVETEQTSKKNKGNKS